MVMSPEHPFIEKWQTGFPTRSGQPIRRKLPKNQILNGLKSRTIRPASELRAFLVLHPLTGKEVPIFISDYVLGFLRHRCDYGSSHDDTRDWEFAKKFSLPIIEVVQGGNVEEAPSIDCGTGILVNSGI